MIPLLLLPGLLCDEALWQYQVTALADLADCMVPDLGGLATIGEMAEDVLAKAPPRFALAGLSMGGYVAFDILRRAPERVTHAAFIDTQAVPESEQARARRTALMSLVGQGRFTGVTPRLLPQLLHPDHVATPLARIVVDMAERMGPDAFLRQQTAILGRPDSRTGLAKIAVPTVVVCGESDILTPLARAEEIAAGIRGAELAIIPRAGHLSPLEQPETVNRVLIDWLGR